MCEHIVARDASKSETHSRLLLNATLDLRGHIGVNVGLKFEGRLTEPFSYVVLCSIM